MNMPKKTKCKQCGKCCQFVAIPIPQPNIFDKMVIDYCQWIIEHHNMSLATDGKDWAVIVNNTCEWFDYIHNTCTIYEGRYEACRALNPETCMANADNSEWKMFETVEEFNREVNPFYEPETEKEGCG